MSGNTIGEIFKVTTFGESHGGAVGCVIDGIPAGFEIDISFIEEELSRRATGQSKITSQRKEKDKLEILSGIFEGKTIGTPVCILVKNKDAHSEDYLYLKDKYRPNHADYTYEMKYGLRAWAGGGRASARETTARVIAGAIAKDILRKMFDLEIIGFVKQIGNIEVSKFDLEKLTKAKIESNIVRCPDSAVADKMIELIEEIKKDGDSVGGVVGCIAKNMLVGLGEPVFDKLSADLAKACMSIPATKGFEIGSGFDAVIKRGSEHNDEFFVDDSNKVHTKTNNSGGVQGGISNGEDLVLNVAFKPTSTILKKQNTINSNKENIVIENIKGRHDPCVVPRAVPIVEAMVAITLIDFVFRDNNSKF